MPLGLHHNFTTGQVHRATNWEVADNTARDALTVTADDVGKLCKVLSPEAIFELTDDDPMTWRDIAAGGAPAAHASTHQSGGSDPIKLDDLAAPDDNTDLNASTTAHGLAPKATAPSAGLRSVLAIDNGETVRTDKALFDATNPAALGTAAPGTAMTAARRDHVHARPAETVAIQVACSDETTALTTGDGKVIFRAPFAFTLTAVRGSVTTAPTGGTLLTIDITEAGTTVLSTLLTFDASHKTTTTATTPAVISDSAIADDAEISINIDAVGSTIAGAGLKVTLIGTKP